MSVQERIPQSVFELKIRTRNEQESGFARAVLHAFKISNEDIVEEQTLKESFLKVLSEDEQLTASVKSVFKKLKAKGIQISVRTLKPKDWLTVWKKGWQPSRLTKCLDVVPLWHKDKYKPHKGRDFILLDTLLSFGTGLHETTQFVSQYIEDMSGTYQNFLDIGTGTGILALVAHKYGAKRIRAIDIGQLSIDAAEHNFKLNAVKAQILKRDIRTYKDSSTYDFVAANLITQDLIDNRFKIVRLVKDNGYLAISGISLDNLSKLRKAFKDQPLVCLKQNKGKQWSGLLFRKTSHAKARSK